MFDLVVVDLFLLCFDCVVCDLIVFALLVLFWWFVVLCLCYLLVFVVDCLLFVLGGLWRWFVFVLVVLFYVGFAWLG